MATSREERMQQRMRGAGRHEVADDSFGFVLPAAETSPDPAPSLPSARSEPNTSAKRRRLDNEPGPALPPPSNTSISTRSSARLSSGQKPSPLNPALQSVARATSLAEANSPPLTTNRISVGLNSLNLDQNDTPQHAADDNATLPLPTAETATAVLQDQGDSQRLPEFATQRSLRGSRASQASKQSNESVADFMEEVAESPVAAPGSGRRRRIEQPDTISMSAKLQRAVMEAEEAGLTGEVATSSPLARKARQSTTTVGTASVRTTRARTAASSRKTPSSPDGMPQRSSPLARVRRSASTAVTSSGRSTRSQNHQSPVSTVALDAAEFSSPPDAAGINSPVKPRSVRRSAILPENPYEISGSEDEENQQAEPVAETDERAEEIDDQEAARQIGRKRPRISPRRQQPPDDEDDGESPTASIEQPAKRRRQRQKKVSPAKQAQPRPVKERKKRKPGRRRSSGDSIPVTVQRYTKPLRRGENDEDDVLNDDIPFTDHKSPNVVDVVLQMCEESMEKYLSALHEEANQADGPASRKVFRTKLRAVEAFQEELRTQLQTQTIALDNLRTLKKRVRAAQKEKLALRNEILRIRAEREQVALKIDAVRMRHETATQESLHQMGLSSTMDDIELAVETAQAAPALANPKQRRAASLTNLDFLISQVANQVSAAGDGGGTLRQIKDFNMFLERAASALEGR